MWPAGDSTGTQEFLGGVKAWVAEFMLSLSSPFSIGSMLVGRWGVDKAYTTLVHLAVFHSVIELRPEGTIISPNLYITGH